MKRYFADICVSDMPTDEIIDRLILCEYEDTNMAWLFACELIQELEDREPDAVNEWRRSGDKYGDLWQYFKEVTA